MQQVSLNKPQPSPAQKVKNILIRSFNQTRQEKNPEHPETSHILKYSPKYYRSLAIEIKPYSPLLSKIKKIKKLKSLEGRTGTSFKDILPQNLWFNLLKNCRKEMAEFPYIDFNYRMDNLEKSFWRRFNVQRIKLFPNVTSILLSNWTINDSDSARYIWNLRRLKNLEIPAWGDYSAQAEQVFKILERKGSLLLGRLESFLANIEVEDFNFRKLFENKNVFAHLTTLSLTRLFDPMLVEFPKVCKNLKCLSLDFTQGVNENPQFLDLLTSIQSLEKLKLLYFDWPRTTQNFWGHFKPQPCLRKLGLFFSASNLVREGLFGENIELQNAVEHWQEIEELEYLEFNVECRQPEEAIFVKQFITMVLKKVRKLGLLKYSMKGPIDNAEPFFVEEVPHLYESLEKFEHHFSSSRPSFDEKSAKFDLKMMKPFRKLKELKLEGQRITYENIEEVVSLLEGNQKEGDGISVLQIKIPSMFDQDWLGQTLKKIKKMKRVEKNLEMQIELDFYTDHPVVVLEKLCREIPPGIIIKGLVISLRIWNFWGFEPQSVSVERVKDILNKYSEIRNLKAFLKIGDTTLGYRKLDGEQERFSLNE